MQVSLLAKAGEVDSGVHITVDVHTTTVTAKRAFVEEKLGFHFPTF